MTFLGIAARGRAAATPDPAPCLAHVTEQPGLPVKFSSKRGCDQIRARLYHDHRVTGLELAVALALSEFVRLDSYAAHPKQSLLARMVHASRERVSKAVAGLAAKGIIEVDRFRTHCRYVFLGEWRGLFKTVPRCDHTSHQDVTIRHITGEPVRTGTGSLAAADVRPGLQQAIPFELQQQGDTLRGWIWHTARTHGIELDDQDGQPLTEAVMNGLTYDALQDLADQVKVQMRQTGTGGR